MAEATLTELRIRSQDVFSRPIRGGSAAGDISKIAATDVGGADYFGFLFYGGGGANVAG